MLGLTNVTAALVGLDLDEKADITLSPDMLLTVKGNSEISDLRAKKMRIINEPGLYSLISKSRKPEAKVFKRWVNHEVLPAIRKTGR